MYGEVMNSSSMTSMTSIMEDRDKRAVQCSYITLAVTLLKMIEI